MGKKDQTPMKRPTPAAAPTSPASSKKSRGGFSTIVSFDLLQERYGRVVARGRRRFPSVFPQFFNTGAPQAARAFTSNSIDITVKKALIKLLSRPVTQVMHLVNSRTGNREKPLYIFVYALLAACRHGNLIISAEGLEDSEEEEMEGEEMEGEEEGLLGASRELVPTFEEHISGTSSAGPVELVVLKGEDEDRDDALFGGLSSGLGAGCEAVLVVEVVKAQLVFNNIWQGMAQGIELARQNKSGEPVRVIVTDASTWYFFGLQAVKKGSAADPQAGGAGVSAGSAAVQGATGAGGLEFSFRKSEETSEETFRLFDCATVNANVLGRNEPSSVDPASALQAVEVMYRLYTALYPDQDISRLPDLIRQGNAEAKRVADAWAERMVEGLERLDAEAVSAAAALETERRLRVEAEAGRAEERRLRVEAEEQLQALLQQVEAMRGSSRAAASEGGGT